MNKTNSFKKMVLIFVLMIGCHQSNAQVYFIEFSNKKSNYSFTNPAAYLSNRAILRRTNQNIKIDSFDLPIVQQYVDSISAKGVKMIGKSKWLNGVLIATNDSAKLASIYQFPFVKSHLQVKNKISKSLSTISKFETIKSNQNNVFNINDYGATATQIKMCNIDFLHRQGFTGKGLQIAVLDAGFINVDNNPAFQTIWNENRILGFYDVVHQHDSVFTDAHHGASVLSCMAVNQPNNYIGTSPHASFYLYQTEDIATEYPIEEYFWSIGAEKADSVGADLINSSLGYNWFDDSKYNHAYQDMDGKTCVASKAASLAGLKGMIVCISAGNEGTNAWYHIGTPADADPVLTVGSVTATNQHSSFSSYGYSADGRVKPTVCTMGENTALINENNQVEWGSGTSFASPLLCGMAACLWQKYPNKSALQVKKAIIESANYYHYPTDSLGFGIPDFYIADKILGIHQNIEDENNNVIIFPNPSKIGLSIFAVSTNNQTGQITIFNTSGIPVFDKKFETNHAQHLYLEYPETNHLPNGNYLVEVKLNSKTYSLKWIKL
ncbi:MAG: hypothetical protein RIQ33_195 [Bacteroidota bacterium]|jgi:hypothetical protein